MAKQTVGPLVRHVEKAVLAICAGGFFYVVAMFGALSPNKVEVNGEPVASNDEIVRRISSMDPGSTVELTVLREGEEVSLSAELAEGAEQALREVAWLG